MMVLPLLVCLLTLAAYGAVEAVNAYLQYRHVRAEATDGLQHVQRVQMLLAAYTKHPAIPDAATTYVAATELGAAERDFAQTRRDLHRGVFSQASRFLTSGSAEVAAASSLSAAADEACLAGLDAVRATDLVMPLLHSGLFATGAASAAHTPPRSQSPPALTASTLSQLTTQFDDAVRHLDLAVAYGQQALRSPALAQLVSPQQIAELRDALARRPALQSLVATVRTALGMAPRLLGVDRPERFLVELMDRGELRATGGYIGDYGVMTIQQGRLQPFTLEDIFTLDTPYLQRAGWPQAPAAYPWWPFAGFALRDSNLSADFPTAARLGMRLLAAEGGPQVQGVVALTAPVIARVLAIVGPVWVPAYHQSVTPQNLERLIRAYTETTYRDVRGLHERFTGLLGQAFLAKLRGLSVSQLVDVAKSLFASLRSKDLQVYLSDAPAESLLAEQGLAGAMAQAPSDAVTLVDANVGVNKANAFTTVTYADAVTLDSRGTATHHLTITYSFDSATDAALRYFLYGRDYYITYLRIYTPPAARPVSLDGFNGTYFNRSYLQIGASDQPGRQMWGGYVYVGDGVPHALHVVWSVPGVAARQGNGPLAYTLDVQHQAGSTQRLRLSILAPGARRPAMTYTGPLDRDRTFKLSY